MYYRKNNYFGHTRSCYKNYIWVELIGFDNTLLDFGVDCYLEKTGFIPDGISLLVTSIDFVNMHNGMKHEYGLPEYVCSYAGHSHNDDRERQVWTNYQVKGLINEFHKHNIKVFIGMFDWVKKDGRSFTDLHPEIRTVTANGSISNHIYMIKRFSDGSYYEDYLLKKFIETAKDYNLDGIHIADGLSSPRMSLQIAEFSDDVVEQSGIVVPEGRDKAEYINKEKRYEWITFHRKRWSDFLQKIITGLHNAGLEALVNSAWTRDPLEAIYRYGADYKKIAAAGATAFVAEDVATDMAILSDEDNCGYHQDYNRRKFIHYEFSAILMCLKAQLKHTPVTTLFPIRDNMEQWSVLHHMPTAMQRSAANNLNKFVVKKGGNLESVTNGPLFCLSDGLSSDEWEYIRRCWDNGLTENIKEVPGATMIWSDARMENELKGLITHKMWHSAKWLAELLKRKAAVHKVASIDELDSVSGAILVTNPSMLPKNEYEKIKDYQNGEIIFIESPLSEEDYSKEINPKMDGFSVPLDFAEVTEEILQKCVQQINKNTVYITNGSESCGVMEIKTGEKTSSFLVDNEEYYYVLPEIHTNRKIKRAIAISKPIGYIVRFKDDVFKIRVPGRGMDIVEVEFE